MLGCLNLFTMVLCVAVAGKRHGKGKYLYKEGSKFLGNWESDVISGDGTMSYPNGDE